MLCRSNYRSDCFLKVILFWHFSLPLSIGGRTVRVLPAEAVPGGGLLSWYPVGALGRGLWRAGGGCEGVSRMLLSFGRFLKVSQDSFGVPDTAGTRRRLLRQLPYLKGKAFLGYFKKLLQNFISIRDTPLCFPGWLLCFELG